MVTHCTVLVQQLCLAASGNGYPAAPSLGDVIVTDGPRGHLVVSTSQLFCLLPPYLLSLVAV